MTSNTVDVHTLNNLSLKAYWAMEQLSSTTKDRFTSAEIAKYLVESAEIDTSRQAVEYALKKNKGSCNKNSQGYKLMQKGKEELENRNRVVFIDAGQPFSAKNFALKDILGKSYKQLSICDPYVDLNTLDVIYRNMLKGIPIRIMTKNVIDKPKGTFLRQLADINKEGFNIEVKIYTNSVLHDRYIMSDDHFWLCGNSLNFIGNKESFIVLLGDDIRQNMISTFNSRWKISATI